MVVAFSGTLEGGFPMRPVLLIIAAIAAFFVWDAVANKGSYRLQFEKNIEQAESFPGLINIAWN